MLEFLLKGSVSAPAVLPERGVGRGTVWEHTVGQERVASLCCKWVQQNAIG